MALAPKVTPRRQPRTRSKLKPKWAVIDDRFKKLYPKKRLLDCINIIEKEFPKFRATHSQYVRRADCLGLYKYNTRRNSPYRAVERSAQVALQTQLAPASTESLYESHNLQTSGNEDHITYMHHHDDVSKPTNCNHDAHPIPYAPSPSGAQSEPHWSRVGNCALLMEEDIYTTAGTHAHTQSGPTVSPSESMISFGPHITSGVPFAVTSPSSIDIHRPLVMTDAPYAYCGEDFHDGNTANNVWHPWQGFGTYDQSPLLGSGFYDNDADEHWRYRGPS